MPTTTRAAMTIDPNGTFDIRSVTLDDPIKGEIQVKMVAAGLCHSDHHIVVGDTTPGILPFIGGHEGAGIVEAVGPDTDGWAVGDKVIFSWIPSCGKCRWCSTGQSNLCDLGFNLMRGGRVAEDGEESFRFHLEDGTPVGQMCGLGTFAERTVVSVDSTIKLDPDADLEKLWLLGCGVGTGWGSAVYAGDVQPGDVVIVMGVGGIGAHAVQGASHAGAVALLAVDPVEFKREQALLLGATHAFATIEEAAEYARSITNGQGADVAIVTVGVLHGEHIAEAMRATRKGGTTVVTAISGDAEMGIPINPVELTIMQRRLQGTIYGHANPRADIPRQLQMYRAGKLKLDELITQTYTLDDINDGYDDLIAGKNMRGAIMY